MEVSDISRHTLSTHYETLGDIRRDFRNYNLMRLVASLVRGRSVLDIGCGNGFLLDLLRRHGKEVAGVEPLSEMISLANEHFPGLTIHKGMAEDVDKLVSQRVDTVIMTDVLEHIEDDQAQLKKIHGVLSDGGGIMLVVPAFQFLYGKRDKNMGHFRRYSKHGLRNLLQDAGFKIKTIRFWNILGLVPYFVSEKILRKELNTSLRSEKSTEKGLKRFLNNSLHHWFRLVENNFNFGLGLSIICVGEKVNKNAVALGDSQLG